MKAVFLALLVLVCGVAGVGVEIQRGSFSMSWAGGFDELPDSDPVRIQLVSKAADEGVTISLLNHSSRDEAEFRRLRNSFAKYAETELVKVAKRHGKVVIALSREDLPSGAIVFSLGERNEKQKQFGVFFLSISPQGRAVQITIEGTGSPSEKMRLYRPYLDTVRWKAELESSVESKAPVASGLSPDQATDIRDVTIETRNGPVEAWSGKGRTPIYDTARFLTEKEQQWIKDRSSDSRLLARRYGLEGEKLSAEQLDVIFSAWSKDERKDRSPMRFVVDAIGVALGEMLCVDAGYQWKSTKDRMGETFAVVQEQSDYVCFPIDSVAKRATKGEDSFIARLYSVSRDMGANRAVAKEAAK